MNKEPSKEITYKFLFWFSVPSIAATLVEPLVEIVDSAIIGPISPSHLSALSANTAIFSVVVWIFNFLVHVGSAEVASSVASKNEKSLKEGIFLGLSIPIVVGTFVSLLLFSLKDMLLLDLMKLDSERYSLALQYYYPRLISIPFALLLSSCSGILRGLGKVKFSFYLVLAMTIINTSLTILFVKYLGMSLKGAGLGSLYALLIVSLPASIYLVRKYLKDFISVVKSVDYSYIYDYLSNSYNQILRTLAISTTFFVSASFANASGAQLGAAHQIILHFWLFASYFLDGFSVTATAVGASLWFSGRTKEWFLMAKRLIIMSLGVGIFFTAIYLLFPNLIYLFTRSSAVYQTALTTWILIALFQIPNSILYTFDGLFFSQKNFGYIRKKVWQGLLVFFVPVMLLYGENNLFGIWAAICLFNAYRFAAFSKKLLREKRKVFQLT